MTLSALVDYDFSELTLQSKFSSSGFVSFFPSLPLCTTSVRCEVAGKEERPGSGLARRVRDFSSEASKALTHVTWTRSDAAAPDLSPEQACCGAATLRGTVTSLTQLQGWGQDGRG